MAKRFWIAAAMMAYAGSCFAQAQTVTLPEGRSATVEVARDLASATVTYASVDKPQTFPLEETTRETREIVIDDYNFDGTQDFAVATLDDGQGVSYNYAIFLYDPAAKNFQPLALPTGTQCDGGFSDVKLDKRKKTLTSACRGGADWHRDVFSYKNGALTVLKSNP